MRTKLVIVSFTLITAIAAGWFVEQRAALRLHAQLAALREQRRELKSLQTERDRLRHLLPATARLADLRHSVIEHDHLLRSIHAIESTPVPEPLSLGQWTPATSWKNHGNATATAAIQTVLWAAAGGDVSTLQSLLELDPATRTKAEEILARLPIDARNSFGTPEALIAAATVKNIPLTDAQLSWFHEPDSHQAVVGLMLRNTPEIARPPDAQSPDSTSDNIPPTLSERHETRLVFLSLRRTDDHWRLIVPVSAIDRIARELASTQ